MAISNTNILIKRSLVAGIPSTLKQGEFAYSYASNTLFIGNPSGTGAVNVGGLYYTSIVDAATNANTASTLVKRDTNGALYGRLYGVANTAVALDTAENFSISGGDITASADSFNGTAPVVLKAALNAVPGLSAGFYGGSTVSSSTIPVLQVAANGRIMSIANTTVTSSFSVSDGTSSNTVFSGSTLTLKANTNPGITTNVNNNETIYFGVDNTLVRSNTAGIGVQTIGTDLSISGNLIVRGTQSYINSATFDTQTSLLELAANNYSGDVIDIGFYGVYNNGTTNNITGLVRDGGSKNYYLFSNVAYAGSITANVINSNFFTAANTATLYADINAPIITAANASITTANVTGDIGVVGNAYLNTVKAGVWQGTVIANTYGGTGVTTSTGTGSNVLNTNPSFSGTAQFQSINVGFLSIGTQQYSANGLLGFLGGNLNSYEQFIISNANGGTQASADFIVSNNLGSDNGYYGDFGMNSSGFSGSGSLSLPNAVYLYSANSDLSIGTAAANAIHFVVNSGATDAMTISSAGIVSLATALAVTSGGTGLNSITQYGITYGNGAGNMGVTAAAGTADQTWSNQILTVTNAGVPVWSSAMDGGSF